MTDVDLKMPRYSSRDWREQRKTGVVAIVCASVVAAALWFGILEVAPPIRGMDLLASRMVFTLKCCCLAGLFSLVMGVEAVAHERLQSAAFDPLADHQTRRLRVNQRYLQNTLEQFVIFVPALFGLAAYSPNGGAMRAVVATTIVWTLGRVAFWIGYHRSAAMRGIGAPGMMASLLALIYVSIRIGNELAGPIGGVMVGTAFLAFEAVLFRVTREKL